MGLELKVEQKQRVYQKQIEQARILQMNAQELAVCIQEAALENPLIEPGRNDGCADRRTGEEGCARN